MPTVMQQSARLLTQKAAMVTATASEQSRYVLAMEQVKQLTRELQVAQTKNKNLQQMLDNVQDRAQALIQKWNNKNPTEKLAFQRVVVK
jgi:predicted  nucleic acid-binding Zn-ribbon protein